MAEVEGEDMSLWDFWTAEQAGRHFNLLQPRLRVGERPLLPQRQRFHRYKCRKYITDSDAEAGRIHVRIVELSEGQRYKIEQGYLIDDGDEDASGGPSKPASDSPKSPKRSLNRLKAKNKKAAAAPEAPPPPAAATGTKKRRKAAA